jgi:hypothetical protein
MRDLISSCDCVGGKPGGLGRVGRGQEHFTLVWISGGAHDRARTSLLEWVVHPVRGVYVGCQEAVRCQRCTLDQHVVDEDIRAAGDELRPTRRAGGRRAPAARRARSDRRRRWRGAPRRAEREVVDALGCERRRDGPAGDGVPEPGGGARDGVASSSAALSQLAAPGLGVASSSSSASRIAARWPRRR